MTSSSERPPVDAFEGLSHEAAWLVWDHFLAIVHHTAKPTPAGEAAMDRARDALITYLKKLEAATPVTPGGASSEPRPTEQK